MQNLERRITALEQTKSGSFAHLTDAELEEQIEIYRALVAAENLTFEGPNHAQS